MNKDVVYTVITDLKYRLPPIVERTSGWDFVCFTNQKLHSSEWEVRKFDGDLDAKRLSRKPKILYHQFVNDYERSIFLDSKFVVRLNLDGFMDKWLGEADMAVMSHNKRRCVYQEAQKLKELGLDSASVIDKQVARYKAEGFPSNWGLYAPGITLRRHGSKSVERCMEKWFEELISFSHRDIMSLVYALWKHPITLAVMPWYDVYPLFRPGKRKK